MNVLDLGCGTGQTLEVLLDESNPTRAVGVDFSVSMCYMTKKKLPTVEVINNDIESFCNESSEHFDVITAVGVLEPASKICCGGSESRTPSMGGDGTHIP